MARIVKENDNKMEDTRHLSHLALTREQQEVQEIQEAVVKFQESPTQLMEEAPRSSDMVLARKQHSDVTQVQEVQGEILMFQEPKAQLMEDTTRTSDLARIREQPCDVAQLTQVQDPQSQLMLPNDEKASLSNYGLKK